MRFINNQLSVFEPTIKYKASHKLDTVLLAWHSNKSITWRWALYYFYPFEFSFKTQKSVVKEAVPLTRKLKGEG
jgi:hypothetical protein